MSNILITGANSGIGLETTLECARRGERVFASMRDLSRGGPLAEAARAEGLQVETVQLDVTMNDSVTRAVDDVVARAGSLDAVVNNAGMVTTGPIELTTEEQTNRIFDTNVFGPLRVTRAALPHMRAQGHGRIVNISSGAANARTGIRLLGLYAATKAALHTLTLELAKEVAPFGIHMVLMEAGIGGETPMMQGMREEANSREGEASPYELMETLLRMEIPAQMPEAKACAARIADACVIDDPPVRFPRDLHEQSDAAYARMTDERFMRLTRLDRDDALYEGLNPFWQVQRRLWEQA